MEGASGFNCNPPALHICLFPLLILTPFLQSSLLSPKGWWVTPSIPPKARLPWLPYWLLHIQGSKPLHWFTYMTNFPNHFHCLCHRQAGMGLLSCLSKEVKWGGSAKGLPWILQVVLITWLTTHFVSQLAGLCMLHSCALLTRIFFPMTHLFIAENREENDLKGHSRISVAKWN